MSKKRHREGKEILIVIKARLIVLDINKKDNSVKGLIRHSSHDFVCQDGYFEFPLSDWEAVTHNAKLTLAE